MSLAEYEALRETAHLLGSPTNAQRLRDADAALRAGHGVRQELDRASPKSTAWDCWLFSVNGAGGAAHTS